MDKLVEKFNSYISRNSLFSPEDKVLAAVSGGVDSMVLMRLLAEGGYDAGVAHCNFQLRGAESDQDEVLVEEQARRLGFPFYNQRFDTAGEMERTGESVQIAARRLRYEWFSRLAAEGGYTVVAIAHHADDSIETFFINLFRGTGLRGLTGISNARGNIVRPLMFASRREILDYASCHCVPFREDSSNRSTKYLRNKIRLGLVPRIREISSNFTDIMASNVERLTQSQAFIAHAIGKIRQEVESRDGETVILDPSRIDPGFPVQFVLYELLNNYGFKGDVVDSLWRSLAGNNTGKRFYSKDYFAYTDRGRILLEPVSDGDECMVEIGPDSRRVYAGNSVLLIEHLDAGLIDDPRQPENIALLDSSKFTFPLTLRKWKEGDWFVPLGMTGRRKVSDFLTDIKMSAPDKKRQFVLTDGDRILWVVGHRIDEGCKINPDTDTVLRIIKEQV